MSKQSDIMTQLHASLDSRLRPEDVAALILHSGETFTSKQQRMLARAARSRIEWWYSSMPSDFARPVDASRQLVVLARLFHRDVNDLAYAVTDPMRYGSSRAGAGETIFWRPGTDFKADRLNRHDPPRSRGRAVSAPVQPSMAFPGPPRREGRTVGDRAA